MRTVSSPAAPVAALAQEPAQAQRAAPPALAPTDDTAAPAPRSAKKSAEQSLLRRWQKTPTDDTTQRPRANGLALGGHSSASRTLVHNERHTSQNMIDESDSAESASDEGSGLDESSGFDARAFRRGEPTSPAWDAAVNAWPDAETPHAPVSPLSPDPLRCLAPQAAQPAPSSASTLPVATPAFQGSEPIATVPVAGEPAESSTRLPEVQALQALGRGIEPFWAANLGIRRAIVFALLFVGFAALALLGAQLSAEPSPDDAPAQPDPRPTQQAPEPLR